MGTIFVQDILDRASVKLFETAVPEISRRWKAEELLGDYNRVKDLIVTFKPEAGQVAESFTLAAGSKQEVPQRSLMFRRLTRNLPGGAIITQVDRDDMDAHLLTWQATAGAAVIHYIHDPTEPRFFWVYPAVGGEEVELVHCTLFEDCPDDETDTEVIPFTDDYANPIFYGIMGLALLKNTKTGDAQQAGIWMNMLAQFLGIKQQNQGAFVRAFAAQEQAKESA